ncbi:hypothetical protein PPYR_01769 [Photinus pyralis]|uniref:26S proteasome non-ATPase regulatory subunit 9 n=1 Tax=Photinus pyralis TaxID=7054 RepID=A0A1Y1NHY6_PHOPY|nr:26S proteasome non-ATPase regulatory subunit 9 [Photinus pyralis]KAB0804799.1 hypothetical protein PPYR_01769 [Photinus pyralis]
MNETTEIREHVLQLMKQKDDIENTIKELTEILTKNGVGMNDPLVDQDGFPISSIDIYQVRHARHRIICLQNDHKSLMKQIENGLHGYYSSSTHLPANNSLREEQASHVGNSVTNKTPFAKVTIVSPGSPAEIAGIQVNDLIVEFGSVNFSNFNNIVDIANVVQHSEGQQLYVKLQRGDRYITTYLIPKKWTGKGLLGCNIVAL